ncbi:MAG: hypothetical protein AMR96_04165 [Candidatus Adiutrix intracellularis]|nr:MAG: hypothetical protein AMR96_04165 [Candidatus Adiutrix intracellularis]
MIRLGLISDGRAWESLSPCMHEAALKVAGLAGCYLPLEVNNPDHLGCFLNNLTKLNFNGLNVTVPHKVSLIKYLAGVSAEARAIGAVNTLKPGPDGSWWGYNTDAAGFLSAYGNFFPPGPALVLGTGGAARAVLYALQSLGYPTNLTGRNLTAVQCLAVEFGASVHLVGSTSAGEGRGEVPAYGLVINTSSASSEAELGENFNLLQLIKTRPEALILDLNYGRKQNAWADLAARRNLEFHDGLVMLAHQAAKSFELWTGLKIDSQIFLTARL